MDSNHIPETIVELEQWMKDNCYNFDGYSVNGNFIYEGYGVDNSGELYMWYFTERGQRENLTYFASEKKAVSYAFEKIKSDKRANAHCIGFTYDKILSQELSKKLIGMQIEFQSDEIPYNSPYPLYRTFIFGCDINKVVHFKDMYCTEKR